MTSRTGPISAMRPAYITATRSAVSAITPMSWVISITAAPCWRHRRFSSAMICACTETSSALVGSSPMTGPGSAAGASARPPRWRLPPENWGGSGSLRIAGAGFADHAEHFARCDVERHAVDRRQGAAAGGKLDFQVTDAEDGSVHETRGMYRIGVYRSFQPLRSPNAATVQHQSFQLVGTM